jgi:Undecaprenyl-phosphate glucose phosphotransferase
MKRPLQIHSAVSLFSDVLSVSAGYALAYFLRFHVQIVPVTKGIPPFTIYLSLLPVVLILWLLTSAGGGLYSAQRKNSTFDEFFAVARAGSLATLTLVALTFFYRDYTFSRAMLILFWACSILISSASRAAIIHFLKVRYEKGHGLQSVLIVGAGPLGEIVAQKIHELPQLGFRVTGFADDEAPQVSNGSAPMKILGGISEVGEIIHRHDIDQIFIALPREAHAKLEECLSLLDKEVVDVRVVPDIMQFVFLKAGLEVLDGIPIINLAETPLSGWYGPVKRLADMVFSTAGLIVLSPFFLVVGLLIKFTSRGPVFYRQQRMSLDGSHFSMLKFRTMREDAEAGTGPVWASRDDPRRTRIGSLLRRTSLDELPQLINILRGEMSFVGPRPERPVFVEQFREKVPRYMMRHKVKCGLTGWAQVNGWRGNTSIEKRIEYDIFYIENWSLSFDLKIIWLTIWSGLINKHAY